MCDSFLPAEIIVQDQIFEAASMGFGRYIPLDASLEDVGSGKYQQICAFAVEILDKSFLDRR